MTKDEKSRRIVKIDGTAKCLCGGTIGASKDGVLVHSIPSCADYDKCETLDDATNLFRRIRERQALN